MRAPRRLTPAPLQLVLPLDLTISVVLRAWAETTGWHYPARTLKSYEARLDTLTLAAEHVLASQPPLIQIAVRASARARLVARGSDLGPALHARREQLAGRRHDRHDLAAWRRAIVAAVAQVLP